MTSFRSFLTDSNYYTSCRERVSMSPGIGLMKRRLPTEKEAIPLAISGIIKKYNVTEAQIKTLETKYDSEGGDWYVALGFNEKRAIVKMDSVLGTITEINEI